MIARAMRKSVFGGNIQIWISTCIEVLWACLSHILKICVGGQCGFTLPRVWATKTYQGCCIWVKDLFRGTYAWDEWTQTPVTSKSWSWTSCRYDVGVWISVWSMVNCWNSVKILSGPLFCRVGATVPVAWNRSQSPSQSRSKDLHARRYAG